MRLRSLLLLPSLALGIARADPPQNEANLVAGEIRKHKAEVIACYEQALARDPDLDGKAIVRFELAADGAVTGAAFDGGTIGDPVMRDCLLAVIRAIHFPVGGMQFSYPFVFRASDDSAVIVDAPPFRIQLPRGARDLSPSVPSEKLSDLPKNLLRFRDQPHLVAMALRSDAATGEFGTFHALLFPAMPPGALEAIVTNAEQSGAVAAKRHQEEFARAAENKVLERGFTTVAGHRAARLLTESAVEGFPTPMQALTYYVPIRDRTLLLVFMSDAKGLARYRRNFDFAVAATIKLNDH